MRTHTQRLGACVLASVLASACGGASPNSSSSESATTGPVTETGTFNLSHLDEALADRSLLSFLPDAITSGSGTFTILGSTPETVARLEGRFWATPSGNVYTQLDLDMNLIDTEMSRYVEWFERSTGPEVLQILGPDLKAYPRGDEFQLGLSPLLQHLGVVPDEHLARWVFGVEHPEAPPEWAPCLPAMRALYPAVAEFTSITDPDFVDMGEAEEWTYPLDELRESLEGVNAEYREACLFDLESEDRPPPRPTLVMRRPSSPLPILEVLFDDGTYIDGVPEPILYVTIRGSESDESSPATPQPLELFTPMSHFVTKIHECGVLPWAAVIPFFGANQYLPPLSDEYDGPFAMSGLLCEDRVPEEWRGD